jgi:hypothetical protein
MVGELSTSTGIIGSPSITRLTMSLPPAPATNLMSLRLACAIAWNTPTAMSSSWHHTASILGCLVRKSCITLNALSRLQSPNWLSITLILVPLMPSLKALTRIASMGSAGPRMTTMSPPSGVFSLKKAAAADRPE